MTTDTVRLVNALSDRCRIENQRGVRGIANRLPGHRPEAQPRESSQGHTPANSELSPATNAS